MPLASSIKLSKVWPPLLCLSLSACTAAYNPPAKTAKEVAPNVPLLWPKEDRPAPQKITQSIADQEAALGVDNGIIAVVGNKAVTLKEFDVAFHKALTNNNWGVSEVEIYNLVLNQMIERELLLEHAASFEEEQAIIIPPQMLDDEMDRVVSTFPGGWEGYRRMLEDEKLSLEEMRNQIEQGMIIKRVQSEILRGLGPASPKEIQEAYERRRHEWKTEEKRDISLITVFLGEYAQQPEKGQRIVDTIDRQLKDGEDFAKLARRYSDGAKAQEGGRQGWIDRDTLAEDITKEAFNLSIGQTSGPHKMGELVFFLKCHDVQPESTQPLSEVRGVIANGLFRQKRANLMNNAIRDLKAKTHIQKLKPEDYLRYRQSQRR